MSGLHELTHWGRVTHICVSKLTIIGSDNGLAPSRCQAITWTNAGIVLIQSTATNFREILREILTFSFKKMHLKISSAKCRPFWLSLNVLTHRPGSISQTWGHTSAGVILSMRPANERRRYIVTPSLIGMAYTKWSLQCGMPFLSHENESNVKHATWGPLQCSIISLWWGWLSRQHWLFHSHRVEKLWSSGDPMIIISQPCETVGNTHLTDLPLVPDMRQWVGSALVQIMACRLFGAKPLSKPMLEYC